MSLKTVQCSSCVHLQSTHVAGRRTCAAFPSGIPKEIILGEFDHRKPHPNDNGIQFEQDATKKEYLY